MMSSTGRTSRPSMGALRSLRIRTRPEDSVDVRAVARDLHEIDPKGQGDPPHQVPP